MYEYMQPKGTKPTLPGICDEPVLKRGCFPGSAIRTPVGCVPLELEDFTIVES